MITRSKRKDLSNETHDSQALLSKANQSQPFREMKEGKKKQESMIIKAVCLKYQQQKKRKPIFQKKIFAPMWKNHGMTKR